MTEGQIRKACAARYAPNKNFQGFAIGKLLLDPAYPETARRLKDSPLPLLDIGCGTGLLALYLKFHGHNGAGKALDTDSVKIDAARTGLAKDLPAMEFLCGSAESLPEFSGDVVMLDVLHYFDLEGQTRLLNEVADRIAPGGRAIVRIGVRDGSWRYRITVMEEWFIHATKWIPVKGSYFPSIDEVCEPFRKRGFEARVDPMWGLTPFNSYLFEFRRP